MRVHVDVTWHSGPRGNAMRARAAPTRQGDVCYYLHIYFTYYIVHNVQPTIYRKGIQPTESAFVLNPIVSFNFLRVGLKSHTVFKLAGDVAKGEASDWMERGSLRVDRAYTQTTDRDQRHVQFKMDYNSRDWNCRGASRPHDRDPRGANSCVFITLIYAAHPDHSSRSDGHDLRNGPRWTVLS